MDLLGSFPAQEMNVLTFFSYGGNEEQNLSKFLLLLLKNSVKVGIFLVLFEK